MRSALFALAIVLLVARMAHSGTVISTNLPANTVIININAKQDGAATFSGVNQDLWYHPFFTGGATGLLQYTIQPGTYTFRLTNPTLAAAEFPALTGAQLSQVYTAWTYNSPWATDYFAFDSAAATDFALPQIISGAIIPVSHYPGFSDATIAFDTAVSEGYANKILTPPGGRHTGTMATQYTFANSQTLIFAVPDNVLSDNNGGVSVVVGPASATNPSGDYNNNGTVDSADFVLWRIGGPLANDTTPGVQPADYDVWRAQFGQTVGSGTSPALHLPPSPFGNAVPELASTAMVLFAEVLALFPRRRSSG